MFKTYIHTYLPTYLPTYIHTYIHIYIYRFNTSIYIFTLFQYVVASIVGNHVETVSITAKHIECIYIYIDIYMHTYIYIYIKTNQ